MKVQTYGNCRRGQIDEDLAPCAMKTKFSRGRKYDEPEHPYRSVYQRDRDRIIHSTSVRRLEYKTQVFVNHEGDYYRTRLTHTLEVNQIARSIARALGLNEDLVEAIALAHDLGHTPFGHSGEDALHQLMKNHGGFDHNLHGLRVVDYLEKRYPNFRGLNLTWEVREGIVKHSTSFDQPHKIKDFQPDKMPTLETQVVDVADEIAYDAHDLDDGITSHLIDEDELRKVTIWKEIDADIKKKFPYIDNEIRKYQIVRYFINMLVSDIIDETKRRIKKYKIDTPQKVRNRKNKIVCFSEKLKDRRAELRRFLLKNLYQHYRVIRMSNKAKRFIQELFNVYLSKPEQLPPSSQKRIKQEGAHKVVCDYIAGMTDRYALDEYKKLFDPYVKV